MSTVAPWVRVDGERVGVVEVLGVDLRAGQRHRPMLLEPDGQAVVVNSGDLASFAGHPSPLEIGGEHDDAVTDGVATPAGRFELGAGDVALGGLVGAGGAVEGGDVGSSPGEQDRLSSGVSVPAPRLDSCADGVGPCG